MTRQLNLFDSFKTKADKEFKEYHKRNLHIFEKFVKMTRQVLHRNRGYYGAWAVFQIMRWETDIAGDDCLKINNNYIARYTRLLEEKHPELKGIYKTRRLRT